MGKWVLNQEEMILVECSCFRIVRVTPTQYVIQNQNGIPLGEYLSLEEAKETLNELMKNMKVFKIPKREKR